MWFWHSSSLSPRVFCWCSRTGEIGTREETHKKKTKSRREGGKRGVVSARVHTHEYIYINTCLCTLQNGDAKPVAVQMRKEGGKRRGKKKTCPRATHTDGRLEKKVGRGKSYSDCKSFRFSSSGLQWPCCGSVLLLVPSLSRLCVGLV